jgi:hypothetical protein
VSAHQEHGKGDNPPHGAIITYYLKEKPKRPITIEVLDEQNRRVIFIDGKDGKKEEEADWSEDLPLEPRRPEVPAEAGVNRFVWDLTHAGADIIPRARVDAGNPTTGPLVSPGIYTVKVTVDGKVLTGKCEVRMDPRVTEPRGSLRADAGLEIIEIAPREVGSKTKGDVPEPVWLKRAPGIATIIAEAREQEKLALQLRDDISKLTGMVARLRDVRKQLDLHAELLAKETKAKTLLKDGKALIEKLDALEARLHNPKAEVTYDILAMKGGARLYSQLSFLYDAVIGADGSPTQGMDERAAELHRELETYEVQFELIRQEDLAKLNDLAKKLQVPTVWIPAASKKK